MNVEHKLRLPLLRQQRPTSAVSTMVGLAGLAGLLAWTAVSRIYGMAGPFVAIAAMLACGIPMILWSIFVDRVHRNSTTGIDWDASPRPLAETLDISISKITGLWTIWALIGALYCVGRWYWDGHYVFAMQLFGAAAIPLLILSIPYVIWLDRRLKEPYDGAWHFGQLLIGRVEIVDKEVLYDFFRSWAIKAFFLAFMVAVAPANWRLAVAEPTEWIVASPVNFSIWLIRVTFMIDVVFATVGYVLTMKPLDSHIRSANPHAAAWTAALICYPPFSLMQMGGPLDHGPGTAGEFAWTHWLGAYPLLMVAVGFVLVFLAAVYAWATVAFGIRFSNLTHRGILTHGPYAFTKHPAYLSKNLFWWLSFLPFCAVTGNPVDMVRNTVLLALVSGVYYWRARTEERHLMADPAYREYAEWMERNGPIPRLVNRLVPHRKRRGTVAAE